MGRAVVGGECILAVGVQRFRDGVVVVEQPLLVHPRVLVHRVTAGEPVAGGFHASVVLAKPGVDERLQPGVRHARVRPKPPIFGQPRLRLAAGCWRVVEAAVVDLPGPRQPVVLRLAVLSPREEHERLLHRFVLFSDAGFVQGIHEELRVREVRPVVRSVALPAVRGVGLAQAFAFVPLKFLEERDLLLQIGSAGSRQCEHRERGVVIAVIRAGDVDAAVVLRVLREERQPISDSRVIHRNAASQQRRHGQRRCTDRFAFVPRAVFKLCSLEVLHAGVDHRGAVDDFGLSRGGQQAEQEEAGHTGIVPGAVSP